MKILFATDGSENAAHARAVLQGLPFGADTRVRIMTVIPDGPTVEQTQTDTVGSPWNLLAGLRQVEAPAAHGLVEWEAKALEAHRWMVETEVRRGDPAGQILQAAREWEADLIVLGSRGITALELFALGSVARTVAHSAPCPLLLARPPRATIRQIILATDATPVAERAAEFLAQLPPLAAQIHVVYVIKPYRPFLGLVPAPRADLEHAVREVRSGLRQSAKLLTEGTTRLLEAAGKRAHGVVLEGDPAQEILRYAEEQEADLILCGRCGEHGVRELFLGSVADRLLSHAPCSILVVPPPG